MHPDLFTCAHPHSFHKHHKRHGRKHHGSGHRGMKYMKFHEGLHPSMGQHHSPIHFGKHGMPMNRFGRRGMMQVHEHPFPAPFHHPHRIHHRMNLEQREPIFIRIELNANPTVQGAPIHKHKEMKKYMKQMRKMKHRMRCMREDSSVGDYQIFRHSPHGHHHRRRFYRASSV